MHQRPVAPPPSRIANQALSKVPEVTIFFWVIKILATTVGETAADYLNMTLGFGLTNTTIVTVAVLGVSLAGQFAVRRYIPVLYWWIVVVISVTGTLITDNLTDNLGVPLIATTIAFAAVLIAVFTAWYVVEGTLSIHSIRTPRREAFYWLAILFTFALGTAAGDLIAEKFALGYTWSLVLFAAVIGAITLSHCGVRLNAVIAFWAAYIITRPLGASLGDLLTQPADAGGLGLGTTGVNIAFFVVIIALVAYLTATKVDRREQRDSSTGTIREAATS